MRRRGPPELCRKGTKERGGAGSWAPGAALCRPSLRSTAGPPLRWNVLTFVPQGVHGFFRLVLVDAPIDAAPGGPVT
jgi:hypothetical protein